MVKRRFTATARTGKWSYSLSAHRVFVLALFTGAVTACSTATIDARPLSQSTSDVAQATATTNVYERGRSHLLSGQYGQALQAFFAALREDPDAVRTLNAIAITYDQLGRYDLSRRYYDEALARDPLSPATLNNLGRSCLRQGRRDWALDYFRRAVAIAQNDPRIAANLEAALRTEPATAVETSLAEGEGGNAPVSQAALPRIERVSSVLQEVVTRPALSPGAGAPIPRMPNNRVHAAMGGASFAIENGAGTRRLAARMRVYLARFGVSGASIGNADRFSYETSIISYRPGFEEKVRRIAAALPMPITTRIDPLLPKDVVLLLGRDLMSFKGDVQIAYREL